MRTAFIALVVAAVLVGAAPALAQPDIVIIDIDRIVRGAEGEIFEVAAQTVDPGLVGRSCTGTATIENNSSEHPNNDLIIESGGNTAEIADYERVAGQTTSMTMTLVLGETITVRIRLGSDGVASEGVLVALTCTAVQDPPPTTTTTTPPPTTTAPPTTTTAPPTTTTAPPTTTTLPPTTTTTTAPSGSTTTTEAPPVGAVSAGGGSTAMTSDQAVGWTVAATVALLGALALAFAGYRRISSGD